MSLQGLPTFGGVCGSLVRTKLGVFRSTIGGGPEGNPSGQSNARGVRYGWLHSCGVITRRMALFETFEGLESIHNVVFFVRVETSSVIALAFLCSRGVGIGFTCLVLGFVISSELWRKDLFLHSLV
eukprot:TRINITY_DN7375_c0_g1_i8.p2 TRINITY_DN7375_c0_g1~~TRINITY_DN7375_c0_g1_i8.p2  ORF type:complete len:126 (-),score=10.26 TRINITY_DN7375_c0_g1_i8:929-1306(-)